MDNANREFQINSFFFYINEFQKKNYIIYLLLDQFGLYKVINGRFGHV